MNQLGSWISTRERSMIFFNISKNVESLSRSDLNRSRQSFYCLSERKWKYRLETILVMEDIFIKWFQFSLQSKRHIVSSGSDRKTKWVGHFKRKGAFIRPCKLRKWVEVDNVGCWAMFKGHEKLVTINFNQFIWVSVFCYQIVFLVN